MTVEVECYAGYKADERPLRFRAADRSYEVVAVLDRWYGPSKSYFKVEADDGNLYVLLHEWASESAWSMEAVRSADSIYS